VVSLITIDELQKAQKQREKRKVSLNSITSKKCKCVHVFEDDQCRVAFRGVAQSI
jgi:hypothetical protein